MQERIPLPKLHIDDVINKLIEIKQQYGNLPFLNIVDESGAYTEAFDIRVLEMDCSKAEDPMVSTIYFHPERRRLNPKYERVKAVIVD